MIPIEELKLVCRAVYIYISILLMIPIEELKLHCMVLGLYVFLLLMIPIEELKRKSVLYRYRHTKPFDDTY